MINSDKIYDQSPPPQDFRREVLIGLTSEKKWLSPKLFYDAAGSKLFEEITRLAEYYPSRTEKWILDNYMEEICSLFDDDSMLVELGAGDASKTEQIIARCNKISCYMPIDISKVALADSLAKYGKKFPNLKIIPVCADYTKNLMLPHYEHGGNLGLFFLGSTIGNFEPYDAADFLRKCSEIIDGRDFFIIGVDLKKDKETLEKAYNDSEGVTAKFNLNLITRIKNELKSDIKEDDFYHKAVYNEQEGRIEMYLIAKRSFTVDISGRSVDFYEGEKVHTENSYKYSVDQFTNICRLSGLLTEKVLTDSDSKFALFVLRTRKAN